MCESQLISSILSNFVCASTCVNFVTIFIYTYSTYLVMTTLSTHTTVDIYLPTHNYPVQVQLCSNSPFEKLLQTLEGKLMEGQIFKVGGEGGCA